MVTNFGVLDAAAVKKRERITNHDVKAVEYVLKEKFYAHPELSKVCFPTSIP
jgi:adenylosuccinate lyase